MTGFKDQVIRSAKAGLLAGVFVLPAAAEAVEKVPAARLPTTPVCYNLKEIQSGKNAVQNYIAETFRKAGVGFNQPKMAGKEFQVCLNPYMRGINDMGGLYDGVEDRLDIDSSSAGDDVERALSVKHEMRHRDQFVKNINPIVAGNVPRYERVIFAMMIEADARVDEILMADAARREGRPEYMKSLLRDEYSKPLIQAFEQSMRREPGNLQAGARAIIRQFFSTPQLVKAYSEFTIMQIEGPRRAYYNPAKPQETLLDDARLKKFGERDGVANYMDQELMKIIRNSLTQAKYDLVVRDIKSPAAALRTAKP